MFTFFKLPYILGTILEKAKVFFFFFNGIIFGLRMDSDRFTFILKSNIFDKIKIFWIALSF